MYLKYAMENAGTMAKARGRKTKKRTVYILKFDYKMYGSKLSN